MAVSQNGGCHEPWVSILFVSSFGWFGITHFLGVLFYDFTIFQWIFGFLRSQKAVRTLILDWFINISWCSEVAIIVKHWCAPRSCPFVLHRCQITSVFWSACFLVEHMFFYCWITMFEYVVYCADACRCLMKQHVRCDSDFWPPSSCGGVAYFHTSTWVNMYSMLVYDGICISHYILFNVLFREGGGFDPLWR